MNLCLIVHGFNLRKRDEFIYPLGLLYVSAVLKGKGHRVKILDYNLHRYDLQRELEGQDCALFGGSLENFDRIRADSRTCRASGVKSILGGYLATFRTDEMLQYFDVVVVGEAEEVLEQALDSRGKVQGRKPQLENLPYPDFDGFHIQEYFRRKGNRFMAIITSRGCPYSCSFCAHACAFQKRPLDDVFREIDLYIQKYGITGLWFYDSTLNLSKERFLGICDGMEKRQIPWAGFIRVDPFDEEMARAAQKAGCRYLMAGVESLRQDKLDRMNKGITVAQIYQALDLLRKYQIPYGGNILLGFEGETEEEIMAELNQVPREYNLFPAFVDPALGTKEVGKSGL